MKKLYINVNDYQGGDFAIGCYGTLKQWREKAMEWSDMDDNYSLYNELKYYKIKNAELIDFINNFWDIEIVEFDTKKQYDFELWELGE